jgi:hypothetical protein
LSISRIQESALSCGIYRSTGILPVSGTRAGCPCYIHNRFRRSYSVIALHPSALHKARHAIYDNQVPQWLIQDNKD